MRIRDRVLPWTVDNGFLWTTGKLLEMGADVNSKNNAGETALYKACENDDIDVVKLLLKHGADISTFNRDALIQVCEFASHW